MALALVMGNMIGSGVYLLPTALAPLGWNAVVGWLITIGGTLCLALVFARLARTFPLAGGPYVFVREAFGRPAGFAVAWAYWISVWVANAAISVAAVSFLSVFVPAIGEAAGLPAVLAVVMIWTLTTLNCLSIRAAGGFQLVTVLIKVLPIIGAIVIAALVGLGAAPQHQPLPPFEPASFGASGIAAAGALTLWAMQGFETATIPAERVQHAERTVPRATLIGTALTGALYLVACTAVAMLLPLATASASDAPFSDFARLYLGQEAALAIAGFAAVSAIGALNGWTLIQGELPLALARDGSFPAWFGKTSAAGTPVRAHLVSSSLVTILVLANYSRSMQGLFLFMALLATVAALFLYVVTAPAAVKLMNERRLPRSTGLLAAAVIGFLYALWTLWGAGAEATAWGAVLIGAGVPVYFLMRRAATTPAAEMHPAAPPESAA
ncbi:MAG: amino acid permease [Pseudomonadota bacterium]|nr:amino acid permease [Pseudomonadota bacterium]